MQRELDKGGALQAARRRWRRRCGLLHAKRQPKLRAGGAHAQAKACRHRFCRLGDGARRWPGLVRVQQLLEERRRRRLSVGYHTVKLVCNKLLQRGAAGQPDVVYRRHAVPAWHWGERRSGISCLASEAGSPSSCRMSQSQRAGWA